MSAASTLGFDPMDHEFRPCPLDGSRSPCPALNALANHGFISRRGRRLSFFEVVGAIVLVYNLSYPLACLLTLAGFITCGRVSLWRRPSIPRWKHSSFLLWLLIPLLLPIKVALCFVPRFLLDLSSLSRRGTLKIAHDASFVHPNSVPSVAPDPTLLMDLLEYSSGRRDIDGTFRGGLGLIDIARFHARRVDLAPHPLSDFHLQISLGECALTWEVLRGHQCYTGSEEHDRRACMLKGRVNGVVPVTRLQQWFGEERLPDGWWDVGGVRPRRPVGIIRARFVANFIGALALKSSRSKP
ncbi:hypothetical protein CVT25_002798 [Psilocybe cyanescens]|uniref:Heme haloperoxidase family profile domain-containing protein n=1 Tax=Psilocybe cyanescens TaxID=93625 RepID=A0A409WKX6_PSICY|nr:hypothetical protein CVT25_002798 [Psilocybe cyanescens]